MNLGDPRFGRCTGEDDILMILMTSIKMGDSGTCTVEHLSKIYRTSIESLSKIYRTSIENLSNIYRTSIEHLSNIYRTSMDLGWISGVS